MSSKSAVKKSSPVVTAASVVAAAPVAATPASKKAVKASAVPAASEVVAAAVPVVAEAVVSEEERSLQDEIKVLQDQLTAIREATTSALASLKRVAKRATLDVKDARKNRRKTKEENGEPRKPSNFEIPVAISDELSAFFGGGKSVLMSRAEVNKRMFAFSKENFLSEGQTIHLESTPELLAKGFKPAAAASLRKLLALPQGEKLTIFNIQKYMGRHYSKPAATA